MGLIRPLTGDDYPGVVMPMRPEREYRALQIQALEEAAIIGTSENSINKTQWRAHAGVRRGESCEQPRHEPTV
jgi:hypothetical protein